MSSNRPSDPQLPATGRGLRSAPLFAALPVEVLRELRRIGSRRSCSPGLLVVDAQEDTDFIGYVSRGILRMQKTMPDGRQHIVGLLMDNDLFGRVFDGRHRFAIEAAVQTDIRTFPRGAFEELLMRTPELERLVLLNCLDELDSAREWMLILANHRIAGRLAGFLLLLCRSSAKTARFLTVIGDRLEVQIPVSRTDLAHLLGTRPESLSRAVHALARDGIIEIVTPYRMAILDRQALVDLSGAEDIVPPPAAS